MAINVDWFLATSGDSRNVVPGLGGHGRPPSLDDVGQVARAADQLGFDAVLTPTGTHCEDAWLVITVRPCDLSRRARRSSSRPAATITRSGASRARQLRR
jgi:alkanesulfonate monooxygenase SsuD/methylene tetrahydromethanopterin reductase-like flavin-dependent oxidoreductase (luciferase family)